MTELHRAGSLERGDRFQPVLPGMELDLGFTHLPFYTVSSARATEEKVLLTTVEGIGFHIPKTDLVRTIKGETAMANFRKLTAFDTEKKTDYTARVNLDQVALVLPSLQIGYQVVAMVNGASLLVKTNEEFEKAFGG